MKIRFACSSPTIAVITSAASGQIRVPSVHTVGVRTDHMDHVVN